VASVKGRDLERPMEVKWLRSRDNKVFVG